jgi:hypothetical protein
VGNLKNANPKNTLRLPFSLVTFFWASKRKNKVNAALNFTHFVRELAPAGTRFFRLLSLFQGKERNSHSAVLIFKFFFIKKKEQKGYL